MPLSNRYYLEDAVFTAYLEGPDDLIAGIAENLSRPVFPLYLGRRSCPPARYPFHKVVEKDLADAIHDEPWAASEHIREHHRSSHAVLTVLADTGIELGGTVTAKRRVPDVPVSFDSDRRRYSTREVVETTVEVSRCASDTHREARPAAKASSSGMGAARVGNDYADPWSPFDEE